jgi:hypothetical protein
MVDAISTNVEKTLLMQDILSWEGYFIGSRNENG